MEVEESFRHHISNIAEDEVALANFSERLQCLTNRLRSQEDHLEKFPPPNNDVASAAEISKYIGPRFV